MNTAAINPYRRWASQARNTLVIAVLLGLMLSLVEPIPVLVPLLGATLVGTVALILWISFWIVARTLDGELMAFEKGDHLGRWPVTQGRFDAWLKERAKTYKKAPWLVSGILFMGGAFTAMLAALDGETGDAGWILGISALVAVLAFGVARWLVSGVKVDADGPAECIVGHKGALIGGVFVQWRGFGFTWQHAEVMDDPPALRVSFLVQGRHSQVEHVVDLPVAVEELGVARAAADRLNRDEQARLLPPVFDQQPVDAVKMPHIVGHKGEAAAERVPCDHRVHRADRRAAASKLSG